MKQPQFLHGDINLHSLKLLENALAGHGENMAVTNLVSGL